MSKSLEMHKDFDGRKAGWINVEPVAIDMLWFSNEVERTQQTSMFAVFFRNQNAYFMDTRSAARLAASKEPQPVAIS